MRLITLLLGSIICCSCNQENHNTTSSKKNSQVIQQDHNVASNDIDSNAIYCGTYITSLELQDSICMLTIAIMSKGDRLIYEMTGAGGNARGYLSLAKTNEEVSLNFEGWKAAKTNEYVTGIYKDNQIIIMNYSSENKDGDVQIKNCNEKWIALDKKD